MVKDQAEADEDMSLKQRLVLAGGSTLSGASEMVDNEVVAGAMEVGGEFVGGRRYVALFPFLLWEVSLWVAGGTCM